MLLTLTERLARVAAAYPDRVAILAREDDSLQEFTYSRVYGDCLRVAQGLRGAGVAPGDRVALLLENRPEWVLAYFGILYAGAVAVPLDNQSRPETVAYAISQTRAKVLIASGEAPLNEFQAFSSLEKIVAVGAVKSNAAPVMAWSELLAAAAGSLPQAAPDDLASIDYTSGTTGPPKGVMLTHRNLSANFLGIVELQAVTPADNFLALLPLHHSFPFMACLLTPLFYGARIVFLNSLKAELVLRCLKEQQITILMVTPQVLQHFARGIQKRLDELPLGLGALLTFFLKLSRQVQQARCPKLGEPLLSQFRAAVVGRRFRYFICGGARLPVELAKTFENWGFSILEGYGLTETAPVATFNRPAAPRLGSVGQPLAGVEVRIHQPDAQGVGEIIIRGANVMAGYYQDPEATRKVCRDGWLYSGDLGYLDRDGYLHITGRSKDIVSLSSGKNISLEEISRHYRQASTLKEIQVLPDPKNEKLVAVAVPDLEHFRRTGDTDIYGEVKWQLEYYSQQLEPYKRIRDFVLANQELPKTRLGKTKVYEAAAIYRELAGKRYRKRQAALEMGLSPLGVRVVKLLQAKTEAEPIALEDHLEIDLGLDSLALVELAAALEETFAIGIREGELSGILTVADLISFLEGKQSRESEEPQEKEMTWGKILTSPPPPVLLEQITREHGVVTRLFTLGVSLGLEMLFKLVFRLKVRGRELLGAGSYIVCPNHASFLDGFLLPTAVPRGLRLRLYFLGLSKYFEKPGIRNLARWLHVVPVNSARHLVPAMQAAAFILRQGGALGIFPEGARTLTGELQPFKKGVAILAQEVGVPLVPVYIQGSFQAWRPNAPYPRPYPIQIVFGQPLSAAALAAAGREIKPGAATYDAIILGLRREILRLKDKLPPVK